MSLTFFLKCAMPKQSKRRQFEILPCSENVTDTAREEDKEEGKEEGLEEGREEVLEAGIEIGIEKGRQEEQHKLFWLCLPRDWMQGLLPTSCIYRSIWCRRCWLVKKQYLKKHLKIILL